MNERDQAFKVYAAADLRHTDEAIKRSILGLKRRCHYWTDITREMAKKSKAATAALEKLRATLHEIRDDILTE